MHFYKALLYVSLLSAVTAGTTGALQRRQAFEEVEKRDVGGGDAYIIPSDLDVTLLENAKPDSRWIPLKTYLQSHNISAIGAGDNGLDITESINWSLIDPAEKRVFSGSELNTGGIIGKRQVTNTRVNIGRTLTDYGCSASIRNPIQEALNSLCSNGFCDQSATYTRMVDWIDNGYGAGMGRRQLRITAAGNYRGARTKGHFITAATNAVTDDSTQIGVRRLRIDTPTCVNWGICTIVRCNMSKFGNFISISKLGNWDTYIDIELHVTLNESNDNCLGLQILSAIAGSISGIAGGFFGLAEVFNPGC